MDGKVVTDCGHMGFLKCQFGTSEKGFEVTDCDLKLSAEELFSITASLKGNCKKF